MHRKLEPGNLASIIFRLYLGHISAGLVRNHFAQLHHLFRHFGKKLSRLLSDSSVKHGCLIQWNPIPPHPFTIHDGRMRARVWVHERHTDKVPRDRQARELSKKGL